MSRRRRVGVPIERHAETIYTREIHERFYNELYESGAYTIVDKSLNGQRYTVVHTNEIGCEQARQYDVILTGMEKVQCSCGLYEHVGLPCRHSLKVLVHLDRTEIPKGNINPRWTTEAGPEIIAGSGSSVVEQITTQNDELKRRVLVMKAIELSQTKGPINDEAYNEALRAMCSIVPVKQSSIGTVNSGANDETTSVCAVSPELAIACPPRPKRTGRPRDTSLKSWNKHYKLEKDKRRVDDETNAIGDTSKEGGMPSKTRRLTDLMHVT